MGGSLNLTYTTLRTLLPLLIYYDTSINYNPIVFYIDEPIVYEIEITEGDGFIQDQKMNYKNYDFSFSFSGMIDEGVKFEETEFYKMLTSGHL